VPAASQPRSRAGKFIGWIVLVVILVGAYFVYRQISSSGAAAGPTTAPAGRGATLVTVAKVRIGDMPVYISNLGTVQPLYDVTIHTRVNGPIVKVYFTEGDIVKQGDPLVDIDPQPFKVQVDQAQGQLDRDSAILEGAKKDLVRYQTASDGAVSKQQTEDQQALVDQDAGTVEEDHAALDNAKLLLSFCHITAPVTGKIGLRLIDVGNIVQTSDQNGLAVITTLQPITVLFPIGQDDIPTVVHKFDPQNPLEVQAFDRNKVLLATGTLLAIDNLVNSGNASVQAKAKFDNLHDELYPGMFVRARLLVDTQKNVEIIPAAACQTGPGNVPFVFVIDTHGARGPGGGIARFQPVTTDTGNSAHADQQSDQMVVSGLAPDALVVTDGIDKLQDGTPVQYTFGGDAATGGDAAGRGARGARGGRPTTAP